MVDWLKAHEVLYNKKLEGYKDTKKKAFLWQQQAEVMDVNVDELKIWYTSLRTCFTKLKKKKFGDSAPDHSDKDQWVLDKFAFLATFTYEVKKRTLVSLKSKLPPSATTPNPIDEDDFPPFGQMTHHGSESRQQLTLNTTTASITTSRASTPKDSFTSAISGKKDQFMEMQNRLMQQMFKTNTDRMKEAFIEYIRESVYDIHRTLWEDMQRNIMKNVLMYKDRDSGGPKRYQLHLQLQLKHVGPHLVGSHLLTCGHPLCRTHRVCGGSWSLAGCNNMSLSNSAVPSISLSHSSSSSLSHSIHSSSFSHSSKDPSRGSSKIRTSSRTHLHSHS